MQKQLTLARISACLAVFAAILGYVRSVPPLAIIVLAALSALAAATSVLRRGTSASRCRWLAFPLAMAILLSSHYASQALAAKEGRAVLQASAAASVTAGELLGQRMNSDAKALERLAKRMQTGLETDRMLWEDDALNHCRDGSEYQAVEWIGSNLKVKWVVPLKDNEGDLTVSRNSTSPRSIAINAAQYTAKPTVSRTFSQGASGRAFLILVPVRRNGHFDGMVVGVINVERFIRTLPAEWLSHHSARLWDGSDLIFTNAPPSAFSPTVCYESNILPASGAWHLDIAPTPETIRHWLTPLPRLTSIYGMVLALLTAILVLLLERTSYLATKEREGRQFLAALSDTSKSFMYAIDCEESTVRYCNRFLLDFLGAAMEELQKSGLSSYESRLHPEDSWIRERQLESRANLADGATLEVTHRLLHVSGGWRWVLLRECVLSRLPDGRPKLILGAGHDVTELRDAEERARSDAAALDEILNIAPNGMAILGLDGKLLRVNAALCSLVGYSAKELLHKEIQSITHPEDIETNAKTVGMILRGEVRTCSIDGRLITKDGVELSVLYALAVRRSADGRPKQFILQLLDITERKRSQLLIEEQLVLINNYTDELQRQKQELAVLANTDHLTGVSNRRSFIERGTAECTRSTRYERPLCLLMLDVDHFKRVNDTYGHPAGDKVLKVLAAVLTAAIRPSDLLGRLGGEEFAILLPETTLADAMGLAERLRKEVASVEVEHEQQAIRFTVSIGAASASPGDPVEACLSLADSALYEAKQSGRNRVVMHRAGLKAA